MKFRNLIVCAAMLFAMLLQSCEKDEVNPLESAEYAQFNAAMRSLWSDHAQWTRNVVINIIDDAPGTDAAVARLLKNQEDIGNAIIPYYGHEAGAALTELLKEHINVAATLLIAAKTGNTETFNTANTAWYENGDAIAAFLSNANPDHWPLTHMKTMMKSHLDLTLEEAVARLSGDYEADVEAYDKIFDQLMEMADMLSEGIAKQFPEKF